jgi:hypothetical protein
MRNRWAGEGRTEMVWLTVLWFGALWGALEALFGGLLHALLPPTYPGKIMIALSIGLMAYVVRRTGRPWLPIGMALVAAPLKLFSAVVFSLPVNAPAVLNPAFAILAQGAAFAAMTTVFNRKRLLFPLRFLFIGIGAGAVQSLIYVGLVFGPGLALYPSLLTLQELGTKFPKWVLSWSGMAGFLSTSIPYSALAAGIAAFVIGFVPLRARNAFRPALLLAGTALCLVIFFLASWLF